MARHARNDAPGTWHHVMNRGIARRTLFENELDMRTFLSRLALAVRAKRIEVHAFCLLTTHFHLLVRSPAGELSPVMHLVQNGYSRWFNRTRKRDGPLYRTRFRSKRADSLVYRRHLVRYIDAHAVDAGLAASPALYPHSSARCYAQPEGPIWLARDWIEGSVMRGAGSSVYLPEDYPLVFGGAPSDRIRRLIEHRLRLSNDEQDPLDDLLHATPWRVLEWMRRKAALADGTEIGLPVCDGEDVREVVNEARHDRGDWELDGLGQPVSGWLVVEVALLRDLCGLTLAETGAQTGTSASGAYRRYVRHQQCLAADEEYAARAADLVARAMKRCHGLERRREVESSR
jgi:REP element-mobilizing transposase RayT